jgi:hypothetical protein
MNKRDNYILLKNQLRGAFYKDYPLDMVLGSYLATYCWGSTLHKIRFIFYCIRYDFSIKPNEGPLIAIYSSRESYLRMLLDFAEKNNFDKSSIQKILHKKRGILNIVFFLFIFLKSFFQSYNFKYKFHKNFILIFFTNYAKWLIDDLENKDIKCTKYISFNSSYLYESFLCFYFRKRKVFTQTLQHGMYFSYINEPPLDIINYENICAEELLCWGDYSKKEIIKIVPSGTKISIDGYPRKIEKSLHNKDTKILVLLPRITYLNEVNNLLDILSDLDEEFLIRPHPTIHKLIESRILSKENFFLDKNLNIISTLREYKYKACIGFNTSCIFEACIYKQNVIQYNSFNNEFMINQIPIFECKNSLKKLLIKGNFLSDKQYETLNKDFFNI